MYEVLAVKGGVPHARSSSSAARLASSRCAAGCENLAEPIFLSRGKNMNGQMERFCINGNEYELKRLVLIAGVTRIHYYSLRVFPLDLSPASVPISERSLLSGIDRQQIKSARAATIVPVSVAATGDPIPSTAYTVAGRAGLQNPAYQHPVRERGD